MGVIGVPHERFGETPKAYIVLRSEISPDEIHEFLNSKISSHKKLVGGICFLKELPKTSTGKILRRALKDL